MFCWDVGLTEFIDAERLAWNHQVKTLGIEKLYCKSINGTWGTKSRIICLQLYANFDENETENLMVWQDFLGLMPVLQLNVVLHQGPLGVHHPGVEAGLSSNHKSVFRSRDLYRPIRGQYSGPVICIDQSEARIQVTWSVWTNQRPVLPASPSSAPHSLWSPERGLSWRPPGAVSPGSLEIRTYEFLLFHFCLLAPTGRFRSTVNSDRLFCVFCEIAQSLTIKTQIDYALFRKCESQLLPSKWRTNFHKEIANTKHMNWKTRIRKHQFLPWYHLNLWSIL